MRFLHSRKLLALTAVLGSLFAAAQILRASDLADHSPFVPVGFDAGNAKPEVTDSGLDQWTFVAVTSLNNEQLFGLFDKKNKQSILVPLNKADSGLVVVAFDADNQSLTIRANGETRTLKLQESKILPMPAQAAPALATNEEPDRPSKPLTVKQKETEARMMVSDLLEIGMKERERYRQEQLRRASANASR